MLFRSGRRASGLFDRSELGGSRRGAVSRRLEADDFVSRCDPFDRLALLDDQEAKNEVDEDCEEWSEFVRRSGGDEERTEAEGEDERSSVT